MPSASPQRYLKVTFVRTDGFTQLLTVGPGESVLIGRDLVCDCRLEGRKVSRRHMRLHFRPDGRVIVQDNTSHNGTYINGKRVMEAPLQGGETLTVGEWEGRIELIEGQARRRTGSSANLPAVNFGPESTDSSSIPPEQPSPAKEALFGVTHDGERGPFDAAPNTGEHAAETRGLRDSVGGPTDPRRKRPARSTPQQVPAHIDLPPPPLGGESEDPMEEDTNRHDTRRAWHWEADSDSEISHDTVRALPVVENPIVQRLTQSQHRLDFRGIDFTKPREGTGVDAVALQLVFEVTQALQTAPSMEAFLGEMCESLSAAARANAVVVLLPHEDTGELVPRVVKNRRQQEAIQLSRTIIDYALQTRAAIATEDAATDSRFASGDSILRFDLKAVLVVPLTRHDTVIGGLYLTRDLPFTNTERDLVAALGHLIAMGLERSKLQDQIAREEQQRRTLERFHAPEVVRRLMMQDTLTRGHGLFLETLSATILFCDLSGFTRFCEGHDAETVGRLLNTYLGSMTEIVFSYGGTVDKYIGDAIMCIFGAPFSSEEDSLRAVQCAVEMRQRFKELVAQGDLGEVAQNMQVHIGINTGSVVAGTVCSSLRMEYTALGDTVNVAARLEALAAAGQIVIGPTTAEQVRGKIPLLPRGRVAIKGRDEPVEVYEVPEIDGLEAVEHTEDTLRVKSYDKAEQEAPMTFLDRNFDSR